MHFGSLVAALGSFMLARHAGGRWLLRIEDVDTTRNEPGAADEILHTLERFGFEWDGPVMYQTQRIALYRQALDELIARGDVYPCTCSRSEVEALAVRRAVDGGWVYPGTCRDGLPPGRAARAWRFRVPAAAVAFVDGLQGPRCQHLAEEVGDFVLKRADGPFAYQLAVVVDDAAQGVTQVVRGADLIDSTSRQIALQAALGVSAPAYWHLPVALDANGEKLSKQTKAPPLDPSRAAAQLVAALRFLGQAVPPELVRGSVAEVWRWAEWGFASERLPRRLGQPV
jgi:glutamyl-Q tRNA(Asp) synthetase